MYLYSRTTLYGNPRRLVGRDPIPLVAVDLGYIYNLRNVIVEKNTVSPTTVLSPLKTNHEAFRMISGDTE